MAKIVLIPCGENVWEFQNRFPGWINAPLTHIGKTEARTAAASLRTLAFDLAFTSVLQRDRETVRIILEEVGQRNVPVIEDISLNARDYGDIGGWGIDHAAAQFGQELVNAWRYSYECRPPGGESLQDVAERAVPFFANRVLPEARSGKNILVGIDESCLCAIVAWVHDFNPDEIMRLRIPSYTFVAYEVNCDGSIQSLARIA